MKIEEIKKRIEKLKKELRESDERTIRIIEKMEKKGYTESQVMDDVNTVRSLLLRSPEIRKYFEKNGLTSISYIVYREYIKKLSQWKKEKKQAKEVPFPELKDFLKQKIVDLIRGAKEIEEYEGTGERIKSAYREKGKDFIEEAYISTDVLTPIRTKSGWKAKPSTLPLPSPKERHDNSVIDYIVQETSKLEKILFEDKKKERFIEQFQILKKDGDGKSVYQIAKENEMNRRRLLYTLRSIGFPMFRTEIGRYSNLIPKLKKDSSLIKLIIKLIKLCWKLEDNYRKWIELLKKEGWKKSNISCFIKRRIDKGIVPSYYFDIVPPSLKYLSYLRKRKRQPVDLPKGIWNRKILSHKEIKEFLKEYFSKICAKK
ncbi:hypothetical protein J7K70_00120 [bacterium]|nr:hypothetical protein [bacterium]